MTRRRYDRYHTEAEAAAPSVVDLDVRVPRGEAATLGLAFGVLVTLLVGWITVGQDVAWWVVPVRAMLAGLLAGWGLFFVLFGLHARDERRDRKQARQPPQQTRLEVDATPPRLDRPVIPVRLALTDGKHQTRHLDVDITPELQVFARRVLLWREDALAPLGLSFAETPAQGIGVTPAEFVALRDEMIDRRVLRWKNDDNHKSGYVFRAGFDEALAYIASYEMEG